MTYKMRISLTTKQPKQQQKNTQIPSASQWLDMLKEQEKLSTDLSCAKMLDVPKQVISHWRQERWQIGVKECFYIGKLLGVNPLYILFCSKYHSEKQNADAKEKWKKMISQIKIKNTLKEPENSQ